MADYDKRALGAAIERALKAAGVKQADVMRATGKSWNTVHCWIKGQYYPPMQDLVAISNLTGVSVAELVRAGVPDESRAPYRAWQEWLLTPEAQGVDRDIIEQMGEVRWERDREPTVEFYRRLRFAFESAEPRDQPPPLPSGARVRQLPPGNSPESDE